MEPGRQLEVEGEAAGLLSFFEQRGAVRVQTDIVLDASTMLDLYGEDIRARAYVIQDSVEGELMMRPDHTVPITQLHFEEGETQAEYSYAGPVFRKQPPGSGRAREYWQVGYENFGRHDKENADALVLSLFFEALDAYDLTVETGDMGVVIDAVESLSTTSLRKANLLRHIWRPSRFRDLLDRYRSPASKIDANLEDANAEGFDSTRARILDAGPEIGVRSLFEIQDRLEALRLDAAAPSLDPDEVAALNELLGIDCAMPEAASLVRGLASELPGLGEAANRMERRTKAIADLGMEPEHLKFRTIFGQARLEYYDGFVFGFFAQGEALPPVATGGRYDHLTRMLGDGRECPGVGGVIRPEVTLLLREGRCQ